jgi:hypothetical protein
MRNTRTTLLHNTTGSEPIGGTPNAKRSSIHDVRIDHGRTHIGVTHATRRTATEDLLAGDRVFAG